MSPVSKIRGQVPSVVLLAQCRFLAFCPLAPLAEPGGNCLISATGMLGVDMRRSCSLFLDLVTCSLVSDGM